ncbi:MAG: MFS transporter [Woeseiaceae bacterium]|jgi:predicted MFS family arabinose efflux permease
MKTDHKMNDSLPADDPELVEAINKISTVSAAMWITVIGTLGVLFLPLMVSGIIDELGFTKKQAGYIAAIEMAGVALASGPGIFWVRRVNWVHVASIATVLFVTANWMSTGIDGFWLMIFSRFIVGIASGILLAIGLACQSDSENADRIFGYWVACQMTVSSIGYLLFPSVRATWGTDGFFLTLVLLGLTTFPAIMLLPNRGLSRAIAPGKKQQAIVTSSLALLGALFFFMAQGGLWAFLERLGLAASLSTTEIGFALAISSYLGIVGGLAKNWATDSIGPLSPFVLIVVGELLMLVIFAANPGNVLFAIAVCLLQFCWAMGMAALLSGFNVIDKTGGLVLLLISTAKVGYSLGPALMGWLIFGDDYTFVLLACGALVVAGMVTTAVLMKKRENALLHRD